MAARPLPEDPGARNLGMIPGIWIVWIVWLLPRTPRHAPRGSLLQARPGPSGLAPGPIVTPACGLDEVIHRALFDTGRVPLATHLSYLAFEVSRPPFVPWVKEELGHHVGSPGLVLSVVLSDLPAR